MTYTKDMLVGLALILWIPSLQGACRCSKDGETAPDAGVPAPTASSSADPWDDPWMQRDASTGPQDASPPPPRPVVSLSAVEGLWGSKDGEEGWAEVTSKAKTEEDGGKWRFPYPWHLLAHPPGSEATIDCGFHEQLMGDAGLADWRVAYCEGGPLGEGQRHAKRLVLTTQEAAVELLTIDVEDVIHLTVDRN